MKHIIKTQFAPWWLQQTDFRIGSEWIKIDVSNETTCRFIVNGQYDKEKMRIPIHCCATGEQEELTLDELCLLQPSLDAIKEEGKTYRELQGAFFVKGDIIMMKIEVNGHMGLHYALRCDGSRKQELIYPDEILNGIDENYLWLGSV